MAAEEANTTEEDFSISWGVNKRKAREHVEYLGKILKKRGLFKPDGYVKKHMKNKFEEIRDDETVDKVFTELIRLRYFKPEFLQRNGEGCNYRVLKVLGEGLHSCVVLAEALEPSILPTGKKVALKHVKKEIFAYSKNVNRKITDIYIKRILRELKIFHYTINSNHISKLLDVWAPGDSYVTDFDTLYSCTELCKMDFQQIFDGEPHGFKLDYDMLVKWAFQMIESLNILHFADIVHRDIKPDNLLLDHDGNVKLTDFNLGRHIDSANESGSSAHNFFTRNLIAKYYRPFEVFFRMDGKVRTKVPQSEAPKIDVWCVGLILYELLTTMNGNWHRLIRPSARATNTKEEASIYCEHIIGTVGCPSKVWLNVNGLRQRKGYYESIAANREEFEESVHNEFAGLMPDDVRKEDTLVDAILSMLDPTPTARPSFNDLLDHPCFQKPDLQAQRTNRTEKAKDLLRYIIMFDSMKDCTNEFFRKNNMSDVGDHALNELQKEPKWFRGLSQDLRDSMVNDYHTFGCGDTVLGLHNFVDSRDDSFNTRKAKQLQAYIGKQNVNNKSNETVEQFFDPVQPPEWLRALSPEEQRQVEDSLSLCEEPDNVISEHQKLFGESKPLTDVEAFEYLEWVDAKMSVKIPQAWKQLDQGTREEIKHICENTLFGTALKTSLMEKVKLEEGDAEEIIKYYGLRNSSVNLLDYPAPSNFGANDGGGRNRIDGGRNTICGDEEADLEKLEKAASDGKSRLSTLKPEDVPTMYEWIEKTLEEGEEEINDEEKLQNFYAEFAKEFELDDMDGLLLRAIFVENLLMDCKDTEIVHKALRQRFLYNQVEVEAYLRAYFETKAEANLTETMFASAFNDDVLKNGSAWIFDFEKKRHLSGDLIKELILKEIAVFRTRTLNFRRLETTGNETNKPKAEPIPEVSEEPVWYKRLSKNNKKEIEKMITNYRKNHKGGDEKGLENHLIDNCGTARNDIKELLAWFKYVESQNKGSKKQCLIM